MEPEREWNLEGRRQRPALGAHNYVTELRDTPVPLSVTPPNCQAHNHHSA